MTLYWWTWLGICNRIIFFFDFVFSNIFWKFNSKMRHTREISNNKPKIWVEKWLKMLFMMSIVKSILCSAHINISIRIFMLITCQRTYSMVAMVMEISNLSAAVESNITMLNEPREGKWARTMGWTHIATPNIHIKLYYGRAGKECKSESE